MSRISTAARERDADVIVVGAGPAGSTAAHYLAQAGVDVLLLEKTAFPREKVCGDGLTPRAVTQLLRMGIDLDGPGWIRNQGLRIIGGGHRLRAAVARPGRATRLRAGPHPASTSTRSSPATRRRPAPGCTSSTAVTGPVARRAHRPGRRRHRPAESTPTAAQAGDERDVTARRWSSPPTATPPGSASRWACSSATTGRWASPSAPTTAARATTTTGSSRGWSCGTASPGDERAAARLRLDLRRRRRHVQRRPRHPQHLGGVPATSTTRTCCGAGSTTRPRSGASASTTAPSPVRGAALPMGFNRKPHYAAACCWSATPAAWSTRSTARASPTRWSPARWRPRSITQALSRPDGRRARAGAAGATPTALDQRYGGYYTLGRLFVKADRATRR